MAVLSLWKGLNLPKALLGTEMTTVTVTVVVIAATVTAVVIVVLEVQGDLVGVVTVLNVVSPDILLVNVHLMMEVGVVVGMEEEVKEKVVAMDLTAAVIAAVTVVGIAIVAEGEVEVDVTEILVAVEEDMEVIGTAATVLAHMTAQDLGATAKGLNGM